MKTLTPLPAAVLAAYFAAAWCTAAEPESSFGLAPAAPPPIAPAPASATPAGQTSPESPLIPEMGAPAPKPTSKEDRYKGMSKTAVAEDRLHNRVQIRLATIKAERDPGLEAIRLKALAARTDFEQRALFLDYYTKLFDLVEKIDPKVSKEDIDLKRVQYRNRFTQSRVAPTIDPALARAGHNN